MKSRRRQRRRRQRRRRPLFFPASEKRRAREAGVGRATPTPTLERGSIQSSCSLFWYPFRATRPLHAQIQEATSLASHLPSLAPSQRPVAGGQRENISFTRSSYPCRAPSYRDRSNGPRVPFLFSSYFFDNLSSRSAPSTDTPPALFAFASSRSSLRCPIARQGVGRDDKPVPFGSNNAPTLDSFETRFRG